jgi:hypothetical protein
MNKLDIINKIKDIGFFPAKVNGEILRDDVVINEEGKLFKIQELRPSIPKKGTPYHKINISTSAGEKLTLNMHKIVMHTFVGTPASWLSGQRPEGVPKKDWDNMSEIGKAAIRKILGENAVQIDHKVPVSKGGSYALSNLEYMLSSHNRKKSDS